MKNLLFSLILVGSAFQAYAQIGPNKWSIYLGYSRNSFEKNQWVDIEGFVAPSLYNNYRGSRGLTTKVAYRIKQRASIGVEFQRLTASEWRLGNREDYKNSSLTQYYLSPFLEIHTAQASSGILKYVKAFGEIGGIGGISHVQLGSELFDIQGSLYNATRPSESFDLIGGIRVAAGIEGIVSRDIGLFAKYIFQRMWSNPTFYHDRIVHQQQINLGLFLRLKHEMARGIKEHSFRE